MTNARLLRAVDAAALIGVSVRTLDRWAKLGRIRPVVIVSPSGRELKRYSVADLESLRRA